MSSAQSWNPRPVPRTRRGNGAARRGIVRPSAAAVTLTMVGASVLALDWQAASAAATWYVETGATSTACTQADPCGKISQAFSVAASGDTIQVGAGTYTGTLSAPSGKTLTIQGAGAGATTLDGNKAGAVMFVPSSANLTLSNITLTNGSTAGYGGGVYAEGSLTLDHVAITGNSTNLNGGGLYTGPSATLNITDSVLSGNKAGGVGGGLHVGGKSATMRGVTITGNTANGGGGISTSGHLDLENATITGNKATGAFAQGGGILYTQLISLGAKLTARHITISANQAPNGAGGGIAMPNARSGAVTGSIIAGNTGGNCLGLNATGGHNLTNDAGTTCGMSTTENDQVNTDPQLGALTDNGGPTPTQAITSTSPAHHAIPTSSDLCTGTDQRGVTRLHLYGTACDTGAYQYLAPAPQIELNPTAVDFGAQDLGTTTTRTVTVSNAGGRPLGVTGLNVTGGGFSLQSTTCQTAGQPVLLKGGQSCTITVAFAPTTGGLKLGELKLTDNDGETQDPAGAAQTVSLNGLATGSDTPPSPTASPTPTTPAPGNPPAVGWIPPLAVGFAVKGGQILGIPGIWTGTSPITFAFQWERCDAQGGSCTTISGATGWTYSPTATDVGGRVRFKLTATNPDGSTSAHSQLTDTIG